MAYCKSEVRMVNLLKGTTMMYEHWESDSPIVPEKPPNKIGLRCPVAEVVEERGLD